MQGELKNSRLAAIVAADIAGCTKLVEADTDGTVVAWLKARSEIIDPTIDQFSGRIVKHTGDGFLAEFGSAQNAVRCAIAMQKGLIDSPLQFRMGVGLGDVVDDGKDIHGEGVNLAARIEALAEPGNINISGMVFEAVHNQINATFQNLDEHLV